MYLDLYAELRGQRDEDKEAIKDDIVFEIELVKQVEINVDYILALIKEHLSKDGTGDDLEIRTTIARAIDASPSLRNKKDLIEAFVDAVSVAAEVDTRWRTFVAERRTAELDQLIADEGLDPTETRAFVDAAMRDGIVQSGGTAVAKLLPPVSRFAPDGAHAAKKATVVQKLTDFLERFLGLD